MKKSAMILSCTIILSLILVSVFVFTSSGKAAPEIPGEDFRTESSLQKIDLTEEPELFETPFLFYSQACPEDIIKKAKRIYAKSDLREVGKRFSLGTPISIGGRREVQPWVFPLISDGKFVGTIRMAKTPDGKIVSAISSYLAEELNTLKEKTKPGEIVLLYCLNKDLIARTGNTSEILYSFPQRDGPEDESEDEILAETLQKNLIVVSAGKELAGDTIGKAAEPNENHTGSSVCLDFRITETQGKTQSWCSAYATAAIIRYKTGSTTTPTASGLMAMTHRRFTDDTTFTNENLFAVASAYGYSPISTGVLGSTTIFNEIYNKRPLYLGMWRNRGGEVSRHCLVLIGYNKISDYYVVWNPWYSTTETSLAIGETAYMSMDYDLFIWDKTIYNWK